MHMEREKVKKKLHCALYKHVCRDSCLQRMTFITWALGCLEYISYRVYELIHDLQPEDFSMVPRDIFSLPPTTTEIIPKKGLMLMSFAWK